MRSQNSPSIGTCDSYYSNYRYGKSSYAADIITTNDKIVLTWLFLAAPVNHMPLVVLANATRRR
jgi:hypothetical protein